MPIEHRITWLLVADASHAKVFESAGTRKVVALDDMTLVVDLPKRRDLLAVSQGAPSIRLAVADNRGEPDRSASPTQA
jgi:hypothetical protein